MTARVSSINGVTRLHTFEIEFDDFKWVAQRASASVEASTLGFKPGEWPDSFVMKPMGFFQLVVIKDGGTHVYADENNNTLTIFND